MVVIDLGYVRPRKMGKVSGRVGGCDFGWHVEVHRVERQHTGLSMIKEPVKMNPTLAVTSALRSALILKLPETLACGQLQTDRVWEGSC